MTAKEYQLYLALFNECNEDFWHLPEQRRNVFFDILYSRATVKSV